MTYFPQPVHQPPAIIAPAGLATGQRTLPRDVRWGRPLFKAPTLPSPLVAAEPLPFSAARITYRAQGHSS